MLNRIRTLKKHEDGAVTVDWIVLTAATVGIAAVTIVFFGQPVRDLDTNAGQSLSNADVADTITLRYDATDP